MNQYNTGNYKFFGIVSKTLSKPSGCLKLHANTPFITNFSFRNSQKFHGAKTFEYGG